MASRLEGKSADFYLSIISFEMKYDLILIIIGEQLSHQSKHDTIESRSVHEVRQEDL